MMVQKGGMSEYKANISLRYLTLSKERISLMMMQHNKKGIRHNINKHKNERCFPRNIPIPLLDKLYDKKRNGSKKCCDGYD